MRIFRTVVAENYDGKLPEDIEHDIRMLINAMAFVEITWANYASKGIPNFTEQTINALVHSQANSVCKNLGLKLLYEQVDPKLNPLGQLLKDRLRGGDVETKTLFFEGNPVDYSKGSLDMDLSGL